MLNVIIRNGNLPDGRQGVDIAIEGGRIAEVAPRIAARAEQREIDATGCLVSPPFVDPHFHMDATLSLGKPRMNISGTLLEGISLWGELRAIAKREELVERAVRYCELAASQGLLAIRSHVDVSDPRLVTVEALLEVREKVKDVIDLQLVAFPQDGYYRCPEAAAALDRALDMGVDVVGGIPHFERTMEDGRRSVEALCRIAADRGLLVDLHCDETDDPMSRHIETLAAQTIRFGLQGRTNGSHLTSMHSMDNYYVSKLLPLLVEAGVSAISNPLVNIMIQGRHDTFPKRRGLTRVREMLAAGVTVGLGQDCVMDPWYSMGTADLLDVAHMALHLTQMGSRADMETLYNCVTNASARIMHLEGYGLEKGCHADLVILQARDAAEAIRLRPRRLLVMRRGSVIAESPRETTIVNFSGRRVDVDPAMFAPPSA